MDGLNLDTWLNTTGITLSPNSDRELLTNYICRTFTDRKLHYSELLDRLLSLSITSGQEKLIELYINDAIQFSGGKRFIQHSHDLFFANLSLQLELNADTPYCDEDIGTPNTALIYANDSLLQEGVVTHSILEASISHTLPDQVKESILGALVYCAENNIRVGATKSATVYLNLASRIIGTYNPHISKLFADAYLENFQLSKAFEIYDATLANLHILLQAEYSEEALILAIESLLGISKYAICTHDIASLGMALSAIDNNLNSIPGDFSKREYYLSQLLIYKSVLFKHQGDEDEFLSHLSKGISNLEEYRSNINPSEILFITKELLWAISVDMEIRINSAGPLELSHRLNQFKKIISENGYDRKYSHQYLIANMHLIEGSVVSSRIRKHSNAFEKAAQKLHEIAWQYPEELITEKTIVAYSGWADALCREGKFIDACERYKTSINLLKPHVDRSIPLLCLQFSALTSNYAACLFEAGNYEKTNAYLVQAENYCDFRLDDVLPSIRIDLREIKAKIYLIRQKLSYAQNDISRSFKAFLKANELYQSKELRHYRFDPNRFELLANSILLLDKGYDGEWVSQGSHFMKSSMDSRLDFSSDGDKIYQLFHTFHCRWLLYCLQNDIDKSIEAIEAIHSRILKMRLMDARINEESLPEDATEFLKTHSEIREIREDHSNIFVKYIKQAKQNISNLSINKESSKGQADDDTYSTIDKATEHLVISEAEILRKSQSLRHNLARKNVGDDYYFGVTIKTIKRRLAPDEALILLIDIFDYSPQLGANEKQPLKRVQHAIVISKNSTTRTTPLFIDLDMIGSFCLSAGENMALNRTRNSPSLERIGNDIAQNIGWQEVHQELNDALCQPILRLLPSETNHLSIVSQGRFHLLPANLEVSNKLSKDVSFYCSLNLFTSYENSKIIRKETNMLYLPNGDASLPLAQREASGLLTNIWQLSGLKPTNLNTEHMKSGLCLHISGHGVQIEERHRLCTIYALKLDETRSINEKFVYEHLPKTEYVWISACVLGLFEDNIDGDPTGFMLPFFMKGARKVIGSLTSVPELWMPLLVSLTEWFQHNHNIEIDLALKQAKDQLGQVAENPQLTGYLSAYKEWLYDALIAWLQSHSDTEEYWLHLEEEEFDEFLLRLLLEDLPDLGVHLPHQEIIRMQGDQDQPRKDKIDTVINHIVYASTHPPDEVCQTLSNCVKIFSSCPIV